MRHKLFYIPRYLKRKPSSTTLISLSSQRCLRVKSTQSLESTIIWYILLFFFLALASKEDNIYRSKIWNWENWVMISWIDKQRSRDWLLQERLEILNRDDFSLINFLMHFSFCAISRILQEARVELESCPALSFSVF